MQDRIWTTLASGQWNNYDEGMYRLMQYGTHNLSLLHGLESAIDFVSQIGPDRVEKTVRHLGAYLREGLSKIPGVILETPMHPGLAAGITRYGIEGLEGSSRTSSGTANASVYGRAEPGSASRVTSTTPRTSWTRRSRR